MKRVQISLTPKQYEEARQAATRRHISMSQLIREALAKELEAEGVEKSVLMSIVGLVEGSDPMGSVNHDDIIYG